MGLPMTAGEHEVEFTYRAPGWQKPLLVLAPLLLAALVVIDLRSGRRTRNAG